mgnify:CR=1 FL=1
MINKLLKYAPVQIFSALSVFVLIALQTKSLSLSDYGLLAVFMLISEVVRSFSAQWVSASMLRLYPTQTSLKKIEYLSASVCMLFTLFVPAVILIVLGLIYHDVYSLEVLILLSFFLLSKSIHLYFMDIARLNDKLTQFRLASIIQAISSVLITFSLLSYRPVIEYALYSLIISYLLVMPLLLFKIQIKWPKDKVVVASITQYGMPLMLSGVLASLVSRVDRIFIANSIGLSEAGVYSGISNLLLGVIALVFMIIAMPLYPELTQAIGDRNKLALLHKKYINILMFVSMPALCGLCILAEPLITLFLTPEYLKHGLELFYLLAASVFVLNLRGHYIDHGLQFTLNTRFLPLITGLSLALNVVIIYALIDDYGLYGAAVASLIASIFSLFLSYGVSTYKGYKYSFGGDVFKTILSCGVMAMSLLVINKQVLGLGVMSQLSILIVTGVISYCAAHVALNTSGVRSVVLKAFVK